MHHYPGSYILLPQKQGLVKVVIRQPFSSIASAKLVRNTNCSRSAKSYLNVATLCVWHCYQHLNSLMQNRCSKFSLLCNLSSDVHKVQIIFEKERKVDLLLSNTWHWNGFIGFFIPTLKIPSNGRQTEVTRDKFCYWIFIHYQSNQSHFFFAARWLLSE